MATHHDQVNQPVDLYALPKGALLDASQAAASLGVPKGTLSVWRCNGRYPELKYVKVGRCVKYRAGDLIAFLEGRTHSHTGEAA